MGRGEIVRLEQADTAVAGACDGDRAVGRDADPLRFAQARDVPEHPAGIKVDGIDRAVAEFGDDEPLAGQVDRQVVDPPRHLPEVDRSFEHEPRFLGNRRRRRE